MQTTTVGLGTAPFGASPTWRIRWPSQDEREALRTMHRALDLGVNWTDTAPFYGWGRAEEIVGKALRGRRDAVLLFTKCGTFKDPEREDLTPAAIRSDLEGSLRRLRTDYVDLLQFHDSDPQTPIEESWGALQELVREGKARNGGLSNHPPELVDRASQVGPVASLQHQLSLLAPDARGDVLPFAAARRLGVIAWSPLASGFLTDGFDLEALDPDDFRRGHPFAKLELGPLRRAVEAIAADHQATSAQVAIAWVLSQPAVSGAIVGARSVEEVDALPYACELRLEASELALLEAAAPVSLGAG